MFSKLFGSADPVRRTQVPRSQPQERSLAVGAQSGASGINRAVFNNSSDTKVNLLGNESFSERLPDYMSDSGQLTQRQITNRAPAINSSNSSDMVSPPMEFLVEKVTQGWHCEDWNAVYIHSDAPLKSRYAMLGAEGRSEQTMVKLLKREDVQPGSVYVPFYVRKNLTLSIRQKINLTESKTSPAVCWDSASLELKKIIVLTGDRLELEPIHKAWEDIADAFILRCRQAGFPMIDSHSYLFEDHDYRFVAEVRLESNSEAQPAGGLLTDSARVVNIRTAGNIANKLKLTDAVSVPVAIRGKLVGKFVFDGERYGIGGVNNHIKQFVDEFIGPRLLTGELQRTMGCNVPRGGILSGPPGTGKTLFISVLESLLKENGFAVSSKIISGPEVFNRFVGASEENVRAIFADNSSDKDQEVIRLILIDEIDSMLPVRGSSRSSASEQVVNQFLTCLDGIDKKNNLVVFGTTNRQDLIDPAVMRPGRMSMKMEFNLPDVGQRVQILKILTKDLLNSRMLSTEISVEQLAVRTVGFSGAELSALLEKAKVSALRKTQGLSDDDMYFQPKALSELETLMISASDIDWAFAQIQPQFGKSSFMSLVGKSFEGGEYPEETVRRLKNKLEAFKRDKNNSTLRLLIKGPAGSGKSTLTALAQREFGSFCSYVSAEEVVKSYVRKDALLNAFTERNNHQCGKSECYTVVIDDFDTMINFDGTNYDRGMVSTLDAYTKQSLQGADQGKLLVLVTATEHEEEPVPFLPRVFPHHCVFMTR